MIDSEEHQGGIWDAVRYPALVVAAAWSGALACAVVLAPSQPVLGFVAFALAIPCLGLAVLLRPAVIAIALAFALLGVGRAELPAADVHVAGRALAAAGQVVTITGRITDDSHHAAGGDQTPVSEEEIGRSGRLPPDVNRAANLVY